MQFAGRIKNGAVEIEESIHLAEGTALRIEVIESEEDAIPSLAARLAPLIGKAKDLPPDAAEHHDHYLYGKAKE